MHIEARIISTWTAVFSTIGAGIGAVSAQVPIFGAVTWALAGGAVGMFTGIVIALDHRHAVRRLTNEVSDEALDLSHTRTLYLPLPYASAYKLAEETLRFIDNARIDQDNIDRGLLCATIDNNERRGYWMSALRMELSALDASRTQIIIDCHPKSKWLPFPDFGYNLALIQRITRFLESVSDVYTDAHQA